MPQPLPTMVCPNCRKPAGSGTLKCSCGRSLISAVNNGDWVGCQECGQDGCDQCHQSGWKFARKL